MLLYPAVMKRYLFLLLWPMAAAAQTLHPLPEPTAPPSPKSYVLHVTDWLNQQPEALQALADFHRRKALGLLSATPTIQAPPNIGDRQNFKVRNFTNGTLENRLFELRAIEARFYLWVEVASLDSGYVDNVKLEALRRALAEATPSGSYNPNQGIIANNEEVFGSPPNVDKDGKTDVLLVDIRDGWNPESGGGFIAGFVYSGDLVPFGNNRDVLYLDTYPSLSQGFPLEQLLATAAHEYQHLIHFNYDQQELTFVNEGLSEWAEILNGYSRRPMRYLSDVKRYNVELFRWSENQSLAVLDDYERAGLFTTYLEERLGALATGAITRDLASGLPGYRNALNSISLDFSDFLVDFHTANFLNDPSLNPAYGYSRAAFQDLRAAPAVVYDGRIATQTPDTTITVQGGGVQYLVWTYVKDFTVTLSGTNFAVRAVRYPPNSAPVVESLSGGSVTFSGVYNRVVLIVVCPTTGATSQITYRASWSAERTFTPQLAQYDNGQARTPFALSGGLELLTRFENPRPGYTLLGRVRLPLYFYSQFQNGPPSTAPRDFTLTVRAAQPDGTPGNLLFEQTFNDPRPYQPVTSLTLAFAEIDLFPYADQMGNLPNTFFIGYRDAGSDTNQVVLVTAAYTVENRSFIGPRRDGSWLPLWETRLSNDSLLTNRIIPIRVEFLISDWPVLAEEPPTLATAPRLEAPYPNPFRHEAVLRYHLPKTGPVRLSVYDLLGRQVAVLVDEPRLAGTHVVRLNAERWASGVYLCVFEAEGQRYIQRLYVVH